MLSAIISAVGSIASAAIGIAKTICSFGIEGIKTIVNAIVGICKALGLIKEETEPENLGDKAIQAEEDGIVPEKFDSYEEYVKAVEEFEVDPEKSKTISTEEKMLKAAELSSGLIIEKIPGLSPDTLDTVLKTPGLGPEKIAACLSTLKDGNSDVLSSIVGVLSNSTKDAAKYSDGLKAIINVEKSLNPAIDDKQAQKNALDTIRNAQRG